MKAVFDGSFEDREVDLRPGDVGKLPPKGFEGNFGREIYPPRDLGVILADGFEDRSDFSRIAAILVVSREVRRLFLTTVSRIVAILVGSTPGWRREK